MSNEQRATRRTRKFLIFSLLIAHCSLLIAAESNSPARLFFSDAKISFIFPEHWDFQQNFPFGPLFTKKTNEGSPALISCAISAPLDANRVSVDISSDVLKDLARKGLELQQPGFHALEERDLSFSGHNVYDITWESTATDKPERHESAYFFVDNRVYAMSLQAPQASFTWLQKDFQDWLSSLQVLTRTGGGALDAPAHGGLWIHQTGGIRIALPEEWLIGVADDRTLGAALARNDLSTVFTTTLDISSRAGKEFSRHDKKQAIKAIRKKGLRIVSQTEEPFHGLPAFEVRYEGMLNDRVIKGQDIWVVSPKARWLFNFEGDASLYNSLLDDYVKILNNIQFL